MKLKDHYARLKMMNVHYLSRSIFKCFLKSLWLHKKVPKQSFICDDWPLFSALLCTIKVLLYQAKSKKANDKKILKKIKRVKNN